MTQTKTIQDLASEAYRWFELAHRYEDEPGKDVEDFVRTKDGAPGWVRNLVRNAHTHQAGEIFPDDWRYRCIMSAVGWIMDGEIDDMSDASHEFADDYVDVYTPARFDWLASNLRRQSYVDDAIAEFGWNSEQGIANAVGVGQYMEAREIFESVYGSLEVETMSEP